MVDHFFVYKIQLTELSPPKKIHWRGNTPRQQRKAKVTNSIMMFKIINKVSLLITYKREVQYRKYHLPTQEVYMFRSSMEHEKHSRLSY